MKLMYIQKNLSKYGSRNSWEFFGNFLFLTYLWVSIVTTEEPVFSTALVMKDFFEYVLTSLIFGLVKDWDITFAGHIIPKVIADEINNCLWL